MLLSFVLGLLASLFVEKRKRVYLFALVLFLTMLLSGGSLKMISLGKGRHPYIPFSYPLSFSAEPMDVIDPSWPVVDDFAVTLSFLSLEVWVSVEHHGFVISFQPLFIVLISNLLAGTVGFFLLPKKLLWKNVQGKRHECPASHACKPTLPKRSNLISFLLKKGRKNT